MNNVLRVLLALGWLMLSMTGHAAPRLQVVATIKPLQLLALAVGGDAVRTDALLQPRTSPHDYQLRPSDRAKLDSADAVIWVGPKLELFLQPVLQALPQRVQVIQLHRDALEDPHIWLDPVAAADAAVQLADAFAQLRPAQAEMFRANGERVRRQLLAEDATLRQQLAAIASPRGYMVEHDAYGRFERRYGLRHLAALTDISDLPPGPAHVARVERLLDSGAISCVWRERQGTHLMTVLLGDRPVKVEVIDALAEDEPLSEGGLVQFYRQLGQSVARCLR